MPKQFGAVDTAGFSEDCDEFLLKANGPIPRDWRDRSHDAKAGRA
jgi:hypothetical protein